MVFRAFGGPGPRAGAPAEIPETPPEDRRAQIPSLSRVDLDPEPGPAENPEGSKTSETPESPENHNRKIEQIFLCALHHLALDVGVLVSILYTLLRGTDRWLSASAAITKPIGTMG